jgi:hypothetical protein
MAATGTSISVRPDSGNLPNAYVATSTARQSAVIAGKERVNGSRIYRRTAACNRTPVVRTCRSHSMCSSPAFSATNPLPVSSRAYLPWCAAGFADHHRGRMTIYARGRPSIEASAVRRRVGLVLSNAGRSAGEAAPTAAKRVTTPDLMPVLWMWQPGERGQRTASFIMGAVAQSGAQTSALTWPASAEYNMLAPARGSVGAAGLVTIAGSCCQRKR